MGKKRNHFSHNANWFKCIIIYVTKGVRDSSNWVNMGSLGLNDVNQKC